MDYQEIENIRNENSDLKLKNNLLQQEITMKSNELKKCYEKNPPKKCNQNKKFLNNCVRIKNDLKTCNLKYTEYKNDNENYKMNYEKCKTDLMKLRNSNPPSDENIVEGLTTTSIPFGYGPKVVNNDIYKVQNDYIMNNRKIQYEETVFANFKSINFVLFILYYIVFIIFVMKTKISIFIKIFFLFFPFVIDVVEQIAYFIIMYFYSFIRGIPYSS